jgi:hypothetical protein
MAKRMRERIHHRGHVPQPALFAMRIHGGELLAQSNSCTNRYNTADENGLAWFAATPTNPPFAPLQRGRTLSSQRKDLLVLGEKRLCGDIPIFLAAALVRPGYLFSESTCPARINA